MKEQQPKDARARRFATTGEPSKAPTMDDAAAALASEKKPCPTGGKVVRSGAFDSLAEAVNSKKE